MEWTIPSKDCGAAGVLLACSVVVLFSASPRAQPRFEAIGVDSIANGSGLQVMTVRDSVRNVCYTTFVMRPEEPPELPPTAIAQAATIRDHRLAELGAAFEKASVGQIPGLPGPNALAYQWEAEKALNTFALTVVDEAIDRLLNELRHSLAGPKLVVAGVETCPAR